MDHFAGLDVSVKDTSVCIVDDTGKIVREVKVASEPDALLHVLRNPLYCFKRIGLEAGPLSQWLFSALGEANLPVICVETRHMRAVLKAQINKTDRNDARGIAQMMRVGLYRPVHVKTLRSQKLRMLLTHRKLLQSKAIAIENDLRGTLRNFGLKIGAPGRTRFEARIQELVEDMPDLAVLVEPLLVVRRALREQIAVLQRDAGHALRGGPEHAGALDPMVVAQGLGNADRQTARDETSDCRAGTPLGGDHASHLG
jgi:transposase